MGFRLLAKCLAVGVAMLAAPLGALAEAKVTGTAHYPERVALPPEAVFEAVLADVSRADAPPMEIGRAELPAPGVAMIPFEIRYDPAAIDGAGRYAVRARVVLGDEALLVSGEAQPVLTQGAPDRVDLPLRLVDEVGGQSPVSADPIAPLGLVLPASFTGELPCADCVGVRISLNLWPDQVFALRQNWRGTDETRDVIGRWSVDAERRVLVLWDGKDRIEFTAEAPDRLRFVARDPVPGGDPARYDLAGVAGVTPLDLRLPVRGMVSILAETAHIAECLTGRDYPLVEDGDFATLEAAYLAAGVAQGAPLMASFEGEITQRPRPGGDGTETVVVVGRFTGVWPGETCERAMNGTSLTSTSWRILRLGKTDIKAGAGATAPALLLEEGERRFSATVGCNQLMGKFTRDGDKLTFGPAASTMMACPPPLDDWERQLTEALAATTSWRVNGEVLELLDGTGMQIALFQAKGGE